VSHLGVRHIDLPCTPERVWQTVRQAESGSLPDPWSEPPPVFATLDKDDPNTVAELDDEQLDAAEGI